MNARMTATVNVCDALEDAAGQLPNGYEIVVTIEQGSGGVVLRDAYAGSEIDSGPVDVDETVAQCVYRLIAKAKEHNKPKQEAVDDGIYQVIRKAKDTS